MADTSMPPSVSCTLDAMLRAHDALFFRVATLKKKSQIRQKKHHRYGTVFPVPIRESKAASLITSSKAMSKDAFHANDRAKLLLFYNASSLV